MNIWLEIPWAERVKRAQKTESFTKDDLRLSRLWITGPISELEDEIELKNGQLHKGPKDIHLIMDGLYFTKAIEEDDINLAVHCFTKIHERVKKLKAERDEL